MQAKPRKMLYNGLAKHAPELASEIAQQTRDEQPDLFTPEFYEVMLKSTRANIDLFTEYIPSDGDRRTIRPGSTLQQMARTMAARGMPLSTLIMLFHSAHNIVEHKLLQLTQELFSDYSAEEVLEILEDLRILTNSYVRTRANQLSVIYTEEAARLKTPGDPGLLSETQRVLRDPTNATNIGRYSLRGSHISFQLWSASSAGPSTEALYRVARAISKELGGQGEPLIVYSSSLLIWGWCHVDDQPGVPGRLIDVNEQALAKLLPEHVGLSVASRNSGAHGFRDSHFQAERLRKVAERRDQPKKPVLSARTDGALTAASFVDRLPLAKRLVASTLGELAEANDYNMVILETARNYLRHGIAGAATSMVAHRNTVKYRVDKFKDVVGEEAATSSDVHTALELVHWFGDQVLKKEKV